MANLDNYSNKILCPVSEMGQFFLGDQKNEKLTGQLVGQLVGQRD